MAANRQTYIHTHNFRKYSHASVGLAQDRPNNNVVDVKRAFKLISKKG